MSQPSPPPAAQPFAPQPFAQPYVMMPVVERNGLGVFGFLVSLIGLVIPTGIVCLLGLMMSLVAMGRRPRGLAAAGVVIGLIGTVLWIAIGLVAIVVGVVALLAVAVVGSAAFILVQPEVVEITSDMVNVVIAAKHHEKTTRAPVVSLDELDLSVATLTDPWGQRYRFEPTDDDPGFDVISAGPDGAFGTRDDVALSRLDDVWERAVDGFEDKLDDLGEKMESLDEPFAVGSCAAAPRRGDRYYRRAAHAVGHSGR